MTYPGKPNPYKPNAYSPLLRRAARRDRVFFSPPGRRVQAVPLGGAQGGARDGEVRSIRSRLRGEDRGLRKEADQISTFFMGRSAKEEDQDSQEGKVFMCQGQKDVAGKARQNRVQWVVILEKVLGRRKRKGKRKERGKGKEKERGKGKERKEEREKKGKRKGKRKERGKGKERKEESMG